MFFIYEPTKMATLSDGKHEQNTKMVVTMFIANVDNATRQILPPTTAAYWEYLDASVSLIINISDI